MKIIFCTIIFFISIVQLYGIGRSYSSADYFRTLNRTGSVGTIDSVFFNPSGSTRISDGMYLYLGSPVPFSYGEASHIGLLIPSFAFVKKAMGRSIFFTLGPLPSNSVALEYTSRTQDPVNVMAHYYYHEVTYEAALGGGFSITDSFMLSLSAKLFGSSDNYKALYSNPTAPAPSPETYFLSRFEIGGRLHLGFTYYPVQWFSCSLNIDGLGLGISNYWGIIVPAAGAGRGRTKNSAEDRLQLQQFADRSYITYPLRLDLGLRFFLDDRMTLQITGYSEPFTVAIAPPSKKAQGATPELGNPPGKDDWPLLEGLIDSFFDLVDHMSYGGGIGLDVKCSETFTWGMGLYYDKRRKRTHSYKSLADTIIKSKFSGATVGTGILINITDVLELSLSLNSPIYLDFVGGFQLFFFEDQNVTPKELVGVGDFVCSIAFNWNFMGL